MIDYMDDEATSKLRTIIEEVTKIKEVPKGKNKSIILPVFKHV